LTTLGPPPLGWPTKENSPPFTKKEGAPSPEKLINRKKKRQERIRPRAGPVVLANRRKGRKKKGEWHVYNTRRGEGGGPRRRGAIAAVCPWDRKKGVVPPEKSRIPYGVPGRLRVEGGTKKKKKKTHSHHPPSRAGGKGGKREPFIRVAC